MKARNKRSSFVGVVLCALLLSACCFQAVGFAYTFTWYSNDICYSNNVPKQLSGALANAISPKTQESFFDNISQQDGMRTFTATPPKGHMLACDGPKWVLVNRIVENNWQNTNLDVLMRNPVNICMAYTNVGYSLTINLAELIRAKKITSSCLYIDVAPCFEWLKYKLYYDKNTPNHIGPDLTEEYIYTNTVHLTTSTNAWTRKYYTLEGLSLSNNATEATYQFGQTIISAGSKFDATTNGVTLYAVWKPREITMTLDAGEGTVSPSAVSLTGDEKCPALPDADREGHTFNGWFIGDSRVVQGATIDDMTNITLTARYTVNRYDVTFDENYDDGDVVVTNIEYGAEMPVPQISERSGWSFLGWEPVPDVTVPASNVYYRAMWVADIWHDATFAWQNDDGETNVVVSVREGDCVEIPGDVDANAWTGRSFVGWEPDPETTQITSNTVFNAQYTNNVYEVVFDANGGEGGITNYLDYASTIEPPTVTRVGSSFVAWEPEPDESVPASNVCYVAQYTNNIYEVVFNAGYEGGVRVVTNLEYGAEMLQPPDVSRTGYNFTGWSPSVPSTVPAANVTYTAQWQINKYTVTFDANGGNGGLVTNLEYNAAIPSAPEVTKEGWSFVAWEPKPESVGTVPASNVTFTAQWSEDIFYNADFIYYDGNNVVTNKNRVKENSKVTVPADFNPEARIGYSFFGWDPPNPANTPIVSDTVFTAQYTNNVYEVVFDANGGEGGITNYLDYASTIVPPMVTREGCSFVSWEPEPDEIVPASNVCYVAQYTNNIYEVVFDAGYDGGFRVVTNLEFGAEMPQPPTLARDGWNFVAWVPELDDTVPASNVCYIATWEEEVITYGDLATAADANFELTRGLNPSFWSVDTECSSLGGTSIKAILPSELVICSITGVVSGAGVLSFKARSDSNLQYQEQNGSMLKPGLRFGYGTNPSMPEKWMSPEPPTNNEWREFTIQIGENASDVTVVWWYVYQGEYEEDDDWKISPFNVWIDEIKWTPATGPTEADRPVVSGFSAAPGGGFTLSIANASASFDYVVQTNTTLRTDAVWGEMKRVSGDQAGSIELERPAGVPSLFYRVGVEAK